MTKSHANKEMTQAYCIKSIQKPHLAMGIFQCHSSKNWKMGLFTFQTPTESMKVTL